MFLKVQCIFEIFEDDVRKGSTDRYDIRGILVLNVFYLSEMSAWVQCLEDVWESFEFFGLLIDCGCVLYLDLEMLEVVVF